MCTCKDVIAPRLGRAATVVTVMYAAVSVYVCTYVCKVMSLCSDLCSP